MRKSQTIRQRTMPPLALAADDLSMMRESPNESIEDVLRRQLLEKDRECDKLQTQVLALQAQLAQRPSAEKIQALQKEYTNLEILLQGTQRENERCMAELERGKNREKMLERELERLAGANWQANLDIATSSPLHIRSRSATLNAPSPLAEKTEGTSAAHMEQIRLLVLGMEQRLQTREDKLVKVVQRAETEGARLEEMRKQVLSAAS